MHWSVFQIRQQEKAADHRQDQCSQTADGDVLPGRDRHWSNPGGGADCLIHFNQDDGNIIVSAALICQIDQSRYGGFFGFFLDDLEDLLRFYQVGQPIAAQEDAIARSQGGALICLSQVIGFSAGQAHPKVHFGRFCAAKVTPDHVCVRVSFYLIGFEDTGIQRFLDPGVIDAELLDLTAANEENRGIAHRCREQSVANHAGAGDRRAHALLFAVGLGLGMDAVAGIDNGSVDIVQDMRSITGIQMLSDHIDGDLRGNFAGAVPADTV